MKPIYVALGSSYAAGPFLGQRAPGSPFRAGRSSINYAHLLAARLGLDLVDNTWSGKTAAEIVDGPLIDAVTAQTSLVTVTCGGNDVGYVPRLAQASLPWPVRLLPSVKRDIDSYGRTTSTRLEELAGTFDRLTGEIRRRAPQARIFLVDYLTILPPAGGSGTGSLPAVVAEWGRTVAASLAETTRDAAARAGCDYVAASEASAEHHAWSAEPWTRAGRGSRRDGAPWHPNAAGMRAVAGLLADVLQTAEPGGDFSSGAASAT